jgi:hypothetical protein
MVAQADDGGDDLRLEGAATVDPSTETVDPGWKGVDPVMQ